MKRILITLILIILAVAAGIFYLNKAILPTKIKAEIVNGLENVTGKKVLLGSVRFSIFKGLVLKDLIIRDDLNAIINVKEAHCRFLVLPLLNKRIVISRLVFESPDIFIERRKDNSLNILELFPKERAASGEFKMLINRVSVKGAAINFHDLALDPIYTKEIKGLDAELYLLIPAKIKFETKFNIPSAPPIKVDVSGAYSITAKELTAEIRTKDFFPEEFAGYYENTGLSFPDGRFDSIINLKYKDALLSIETEFDTKGLTLSKDETVFKVIGSARSSVRYNFAEKKCDYTGNINIQDMSIDGIEYMESIDNIKGKIEFSNLGLTSDNITAIALGLPVEAKIGIDDFNDPVLNIDASSDIKLAHLQNILEENFGLKIPADFKGDAKLRFTARYAIRVPERSHIRGSLYTLNASIGVNGGRGSLDNVTGQFQFVPNQVSWDEIGFTYHDVHYQSSGVLTNFETPGIQLKLASKDISLIAAFALNGKVLDFSKFSGKYNNSSLSASGRVDTSNPTKLNVDIKGVLHADIDDLKKPLEKFKDKFECVKPKGAFRAEFSLEGDLKDLKNCAIYANLSAENLSLYGLKLSTSTMNYSQKNGVGDILFMKSFLYGGSMGATGRVDWISKDIPYRIEADVDGVKIEKFKSDTAFKDKEIAGSVKMHAKLDGFLNDLSRLSGEGNITVREGKVWQLNLFRGLGVLLFTSDFSNIIFKECSSEFTIRDKSIYTDDLNLKSDLLDINGPMKIGFDNTIKATVKAEFSEDAGRTGASNARVAFGRYTLIGVTGTLKDPQYKVRPDVENIVEGIAEHFFSE